MNYRHLSVETLGIVVLVTDFVVLVFFMVYFFILIGALYCLKAIRFIKSKIASRKFITVSL